MKIFKPLPPPDIDTTALNIPDGHPHRRVEAVARLTRDPTRHDDIAAWCRALPPESAREALRNALLSRTSAQRYIAGDPSDDYNDIAFIEDLTRLIAFINAATKAGRDARTPAP